MKALSCSLEDTDFAGDEWESHAWDLTHRQRCHRQGLGVPLPKWLLKKLLCAFPPSFKQLTNHVCTCFLHCPQDCSCSASLRAPCNQHRARALGTTSKMMPSTTSALTCRRFSLFLCNPPALHLSSTAVLMGSLGRPWGPSFPLLLPPALDFSLSVINGAFVPCSGDQTFLWKVGEEEKNPPGQSWEWHLDLWPLKGWKAGRLSPLPSPLQTRCSWFLLIQSWANTAIKGLKDEYRTMQMDTGSLLWFTPQTLKIKWK